MRVDRSDFRTRSLVATTAAAALWACADADFIGWTATRRPVTGGHLINVFAATNSSTDVLVMVSPVNGGITTNSPGGFLQGPGAIGVFAPAANQSWTTLDSFLTIGGGFAPSTGAWLGNGATEGGPEWRVSNEAGVIDAFRTPSGFGFSNPWTNAVPPGGGWLVAGTAAQARSLESIASLRLPYARNGGTHCGASSAAAANAQFGMLVAQLFVSQWGVTASGDRHVDWRRGATMRRPDGSTSSATFEFRISQVCLGDLNEDRFVDGFDLGTLLGSWGACPANCPADLTGDGVVDGNDLGVLLAAWGPCTN